MAEEPYSMYSFLLDRTARRVKQYAQKRVKELVYKITVDQWLVVGHHYDKKNINQQELAERNFNDTPTLTRIIDILYEKCLTIRELHHNTHLYYNVSRHAEGVKPVE